MKLKTLLSLAFGLVLLVPGALFAADNPSAQPGGQKPAADGAKADLETLIGKVREKIQTGAKKPADYAAELKQFDDLLAKYKAQKTDDVAQILLMKALLYAQIFGEPEKGAALARQLKTDFPETRQGKGADQLVEQMESMAAAEKIQKNLVEGKVFPEFHEKDLAGKPLSIDEYKGKVVMVDFWATWCGPCVRELPNVLETYAKYHPEGFEIVGISLDRAQDKEKLLSFLEEHKVTWRQYYDGGFWTNKLARQYGVNSIPATYLLDRRGVIIGSNLRGPALAPAVAKALGVEEHP